jgi:YD repeat-containing protein
MFSTRTPTSSSLIGTRAAYRSHASRGLLLATPRALLVAIALVAASGATARAQTAEICGNGIDDDGDGVLDEGCAPTLATGVCESPLSCSETGMISPSTGALRYALPPDIAPAVPFGPGIGLRRFYVSKLDPGAGAPAWKKPLGDRWQHTYMSWMTVSGLPGSGSKIFLRTPQGQDVLFTWSHWESGYHIYKPQPGFPAQHIAYDDLWGFEYKLKLLTGEELRYDLSGRLSMIQEPSGKYVMIARDGNHQVSTVTDSQGKRRLLFTYTSGMLTSVQFQIHTGSWTTQHTTTYAYTSGALTSVTIGNQLAQTNVYASGYLTQIQDGGGTPIVSFSYESASPGKAVRADTRSGMIGLETSSSRSTCSGKTVLYFNRGNTSSCSIDSDCGSGFLCGGKTGSGSTGVCFRAARCLTISSTNEDLVTTVAPLGPPGESCEGACAEVAQYIWNTTALRPSAIQDAAGHYETRTFDTNGLPTKITYGDVDSDPNNGNSAREVYLFYDSTFPGKLSEIRRKSDLDPQASSCSATSSIGCARTLFFYHSNGRPSLIREEGQTLHSTGSTSRYVHDTSYTYDTNGRLTQINGPLSGNDDITVLEYWNSSDPLKNGFLQHHKRKRDATSFVTSSALAYDFWGHPTALQGPDTDGSNATGTLTCLTFDANRGFLTQRREAMAGQSDCTTTNSADLTTSYQRDSALRLTRVTKPDGSCMFYEYDSKGRLQRSKRRDDCNAGSSGDRQEFIYDAEGLVTEIQTYNASNVLTAKQPFTYFDSRKLQRVVNPVDTGKWTGVTYDDRGLVTEVEAPGGLGKTVLHRDGAPGRDQRVTAVDRYHTATTFDTWNLLYNWLGHQLSVTDGDSKVTETLRDDLGRTVKLTSPDLQYPTLYLYDSGSRVTSVVEGFGGGTAQRTHTFTYDHLGRRRSADYAGVCPQGTAYPEIETHYDRALDRSGAPSCPAGMTCARTGGRVAYVKVTLTCSSAYLDDGALDQETWFSYDDAGRVVREYVKDDSGRVADHHYAWTKAGRLQQTTLPSGAILGSTYG